MALLQAPIPRKRSDSNNNHDNSLGCGVRMKRFILTSAYQLHQMLQNVFKQNMMYVRNLEKNDSALQKVALKKCLEHFGAHSSMATL